LEKGTTRNEKALEQEKDEPKDHLLVPVLIARLAPNPPPNHQSLRDQADLEWGQGQDKKKEGEVEEKPRQEQQPGGVPAGCIRVLASSGNMRKRAIRGFLKKEHRADKRESRLSTHRNQRVGGTQQTTNAGLKPFSIQIEPGGKNGVSCRESHTLCTSRVRARNFPLQVHGRLWEGFV